MRAICLRRCLPFVCLLLLAAGLLGRHPTHVHAQPAGDGGLAGKYADTPSRSDFLVTKLAFNQRTLKGDYQRVGRRNPKWDAAAEAFLDGAARYFTNAGEQVWYQIERPSRDELIGQGQKLVEELGCDDPLVRYCFGTFLMDRGGAPEAMAPVYGMLLQAYMDLRESDYNPFRKASAARRAAGIMSMPESQWADHPAARTAVQDLFGFEVACFTEPGFTAEEARVLLEYVWKPKVDGGVPAAELRQFAEAVAGAAEHEWATLIVRANVEQQAAFEARGGGYANTVTPEGWAGFEAGMKAAFPLYERAHEMHPDRPEAAAHLVTVAMAGHAARGDAHYWFEQAIEAQVDYDPAWITYRQSLLPRWGGSHEQMLALGRLALATRRFDTDVPARYYYQIWSIAWDAGGEWAAVRRFGPSIWEDLEALYAGVIPPLVERDTWNANAFAAERLAAAWALHAWEGAAALLEPGGEGQGVDSTPFRAWAFSRVGTTPDIALAQIAARTGPQRKAVELAELQEQRGDLEAAAASWRNGLEAIAEDDPGRPYLEMRVREREFLERMAAAPANEWVDVPADLSWWGVGGGDWRAEDGKLIVTVKPDDRAADERWGGAPAMPLLVFHPRMPAAYEVRARIGVPRNPEGESCPSARVGIWPAWGTFEGGSVRLGHAANVLQVTTISRTREAPLDIRQPETVLALRVDREGAMTGFLNNHLRVSPHRTAAPPAGQTDRYVALVAHGLHVGDEFTIDAIQVRRLEP